VSGYPAAVATKNEATALAAIREMHELQKAMDATRARRDNAVARMYLEDGMRPPQIARITGMSISNVRLVCDRAKLLSQQRV
jgi:DNA-directed RNA polymerase specialized sigma24 family protein